VREKYAHDMTATFADIGTSRVTIAGKTAPAGRLNALLGVS
jgi:hypothetical protein